MIFATSQSSQMQKQTQQNKQSLDSSYYTYIMVVRAVFLD